jgi:ABC-2 type transport system permease protein
LLVKEVRRFLRVPGQTVLSPLISTTLYFVVFAYSVGSRVGAIHGVSYVHYIVPGLVFLGIANNSFLNSSSSLFITKIQGTVVDLLVAPLGPGELLAGFVSGAMVRGLIVGLLTWAVALVFTGFELAQPLVLAALLFLESYVFAVLGLLAALWAEKFEQINFFPTFVMFPLTFLGGVFYSVDRLPSPWREASLDRHRLPARARARLLGVRPGAPEPRVQAQDLTAHPPRAARRPGRCAALEALR